MEELPVKMLSNKPYLIRAFYEWIVDSRCTPFLVLNANVPGCQVPSEYIENGEVTLNISPDATRDLKIASKKIEFQASFSGVVHLISAPVKAVTAIYAQENGQGMYFDFDEDEDLDSLEDGGIETETSTTANQDDASSSGNAGKKQGASHLRIIK